MKQIFTVLPMTFSLLLSASTHAQVVLNEIYADPGASRHEFFELYNTSTSPTPISLDGYTILSYFEEGSKRGFYVLDLPNLFVGPKSFFVGSSALPFNYQSATNSSAANFSWNDPALVLNYGYLRKWVDNGANLADGNRNYDLEPIPAGFNDFFSKRSGSGASYNAFIYKNGVLINNFFGGVGGTNNMPDFITGMPNFRVISVTQAGSTIFNISFTSYRNKPVEYVAQNIGTDNGYIREKDGLCGKWTKSSATVNHTPQQSNGTAVGSIGELSVLAYIKRGATAADSSLVVYDVVGGTASAFPVEKQLYLDNGSVPGELDANDEFLTSKTETAVTSPADSTKFFPRNANIILVAKSAVGCLDQVLFVRDAQNALTTLPVKLLSFSAELINNQAVLNWSVSQNETGERFEVEVSNDGSHFNSSGVVFTTEKTGSENYLYKDAYAIDRNAYYRLKIINKNGATVYSKVILINRKSINSTIHLLQNPVENNLVFKVNTTSGMATAHIYSASGVKVLTKTITCQDGLNQLQIPIENNLSAGTYILELNKNAERQIVKFFKR